ncbi:MAG: rplJ [Candidatus Paceibacter sp.]|jgi:large subunit ribosomal protein L10|nr:rplJ [Candidatus Paceibacter sp.]
MALKKAQKKVVLDKVTDITNNLKSAVFVNFHGLTVGETTELRSTLRKSGIKYFVAKKTLATKAFSAKGFKGTMPALDGELAIAYGEDLIAPAREIREFEKKFEGKVGILGGVFEDKFMSKAEMTEIASIPGKQQLYGMFVNLINSPIQRFVIALNEVAKSKTS